MDAMENHKRKRLETASLEQPLFRSENLWFEDGNVTITAGSTEFKVHRSILSSNSTKFRAMLGPAAEGGLGLSMLQLPDAAEEVYQLLHAVYYGSDLLARRRELEGGLPLSTIAPLLRLGQKYGFIKLRDEAAKCLQDEFPSDFDTWLRSDSFKHVRIADDADIPITLLRILELARECKLLTIQVAIYMSICTEVDKCAIVEGIPDRHGVKHPVPTDIIVTCLHGFDRLRTKLFDTTYRWLKNEQPSWDCVTPEKCKQASLQLYADLFKPSSDVLSGLEDWNEEWEPELCSECQVTAETTHDAGRRKLWDLLPSLFGLGKWEDLTDF